MAAPAQGGDEDHPGVGHPGQVLGVMSGRRVETAGREPERRADFLGHRLHPGRARRRRRGRHGMHLDPDLARAGDLARERPAFSGQTLQHGDVGIAHLVDEFGATRDDVGGAGMHVHHAEVGHAGFAPARDDVLAHAQRVVGRGQERVAAALHRRRAGVVGLTQEGHAGAPHPHDRLDDTDRDARLLEPRALLDVELDVRGDRARRYPRLLRALRVEPRARHRRGAPPPGKQPNRASPSMREVRRGSEIEITVGRSISLDLTGEGFENEPPFSCSAGPPSGGEMDLSLTPDQEAFRATVRSWLKTNMPREWKPTGSSEIPRAGQYEFLRRWQRTLFDAGYIGLTWPKEYGGRGLTFMEELVLQQEMALAKAPPILNVLGVGMGGPTIIAWGNEEQKKRYPAKILSCEEIWCQGYSEPNSGSDLASLQTRAVKDGDHWVINGQKVWTSFAHVADYMMLLARTDPNVPKHKGITYFLLDMKLPGVTVNPLRQITGEAEVNEVFFDNVRVHESQVLGGDNNGGAVGLTTLMYERLTLGFGLQMRLRIALDGLIDLARKMEKSGRALTKEPVMRQKLAQIWIETECLKYTGARAITKLLRGEMPGPEASTGKMAWVDTHQRLQELAMEIEGPYSQLWKGSEWAIEGGVWPQSFLRSRANSIEGGTTEIQKNIIAERLLGLPKD